MLVENIPYTFELLSLYKGQPTSTYLRLPTYFDAK